MKIPSKKNKWFNPLDDLLWVGGLSGFLAIPFLMSLPVTTGFFSSYPGLNFFRSWLIFFGICSVPVSICMAFLIWNILKEGLNNKFNILRDQILKWQNKEGQWVQIFPFLSCVPLIFIILVSLYTGVAFVNGSAATYWTTYLSQGDVFEENQKLIALTLMAVFLLCFGIWNLINDDKIPLKKEPLKFFDVPTPEGDGRCSDNYCTCSDRVIPKGTGFLYVSPEAVKFRENARSEQALWEKLALDQATEGTTIMEPELYKAILMCDQGAKLRKLNGRIANEDAIYWWKTGRAPLRPTPKIGAALLEQRKSENEPLRSPQPFSQQGNSFSNYWRCPHCQRILKKGMSSIINDIMKTGEAISGVANCEGCGGTVSQSEVYQGIYDVPTLQIYCPNCNSDLVGTEEMLAGKPCPNCGQQLPKGNFKRIT